MPKLISKKLDKSSSIDERDQDTLESLIKNFNSPDKKEERDESESNKPAIKLIIKRSPYVKPSPVFVEKRELWKLVRPKRHIIFSFCKECYQQLSNDKEKFEEINKRLYLRLSFCERCREENINITNIKIKKF